MVSNKACYGKSSNSDLATTEAILSSMKKGNKNPAVPSKRARIDVDDSKTAQDTESKAVATLKVPVAKKDAEKKDNKEATHKARFKKRRKKRNMVLSQLQSPDPTSSDEGTATADGESKIAAAAGENPLDEEKISCSLTSTL